MAAAFRMKTGRWVKEGAGLLYAGAVARLYEGLTGRKARGQPATLVDRLVEEDRLTPEAALYLQAFGRALAGSRAVRPDGSDG